MSTRPEIDVIVDDEYTIAALSSYQHDANLFRISFSGEKSNFKARFSEIEESIGDSLNPFIKDLYKIALTIYFSDLRFIRHPKIPNRTIRILLSVSDLTKWQRHKEELELVLYQLSGDNIIFHFIQGEHVPFSFVMPDTPTPEWAVSLFSGGLDSLAGVSWLLDQGVNVKLVSHSSQSKITNIQNYLVDRIGEFIEADISHYQINAVPESKVLRRKESSQRLRSFLYLTLGCVYALHQGISNLYMFENGIMALNVPLNNARIFYNTRTAHPKFVYMYQEFISNIFQIRFHVNNPFQHMIKAEVVSLLNRANFKELIRNSISCSRLTAIIMDKRRIPISKVWHCGCCLPCVIRRIATEFAGATGLDAQYVDDVLTEFEDLIPEGKRVILEVINLSRKILELKTYEDVLLEFPEFYIERLDPEPLIDMYRRYSSNVLEFFSKSPLYAPLINS